ncbi:MAG: phosphate--acyl-ACP acyltransferase [Bacteroidota bacterium]|nr:phosphate--acyl-ACP acyltransferase [Bacteroidota bacterium]
MRIGLDIMGGDFAPDACIDGAIIASDKMNTDDKIVLIGSKKLILDKLSKRKHNPEVFAIVDAPEVIQMNDHPAKAFQQKQNSSLVKGYKLLRDKAIDGFASAGNTGAMMVGAIQTTKQIPGVLRPAIASFIPTTNGKHNILLDVGLNPDSKPDVLYQYGVLGSIFYQFIFGVETPKVTLLNIGKEEGKGNLASKSAFELMKNSPDFNFVGNIEGHELFDSQATDVIVADGFVGNILLKQAESFYTMLKNRGVEDEYFERFNYEIYGGTPILGINENVVIGHGISNARAISNMILQTKKMVNAKLSLRIKDFFSYE